MVGKTVLVTYLWGNNRHVQVLILFNSRVANVVTNQILQRGEPFLTLTGHIVLGISAGDLVVEHTNLTVDKGQNEASWLTLTLTD